MNQIQNKMNNLEEIPHNHADLLRELFKKINKIINGKREIMYSDIINLLVRKHYTGDVYNQIIIWCNYKIKQGDLLVNFE